MKNKNKTYRLLGLALLVSGMVGCATRPTTLYQWEDYQSNVDAYFRGDKSSPIEQIQTMEAGLQKIIAEGGVVPPGYYAHLGLLYGQQGRLNDFAEKIQGLESVTGRFGLATGTAGNTLFFVKGGVAFGQYKFTSDWPEIDTHFETNKTLTGWIIGGGIEYHITPKWSLKAEFDLP